MPRIIANTCLIALLCAMTGTSYAANSAPAQPPNKASTVQQIVGVASFYAKKFHGRFTASGERYDNNAFTAAHPTLPFGTTIKVTNLRNKRSVLVRINDRGAFQAHGRILDLSHAAARELGMIRRGLDKVKMEVVR